MLLVGMEMAVATIENSMEIAKKKKKKVELQHDPAIPILGIYSKEMKPLSQREICTPMFIAVLFTIAKVWKQFKFLLTDEYRKCDTYL